MGFRSSILAGTKLIREAIQSPNYVAALAGWTINRDGTAEFADLTIRSSNGTTTTVTIANGVIEIKNSAGVVVSRISAEGYKLYRATDSALLAETTLSGGSNSVPGFLAWDDVNQNSYVFVGNSGVEWGDTDVSFWSNPAITHSGSNDGTDPVSLFVECGQITGTSVSPRLRLDSAPSPATRALAEFDAYHGKCDVAISGKVTADNIRTGTLQTPAPGGSPAQTSVSVAFADAMDAVPNVVLTPNSSAANLNSSNIRWAVTNKTANGFTANCWRDTNNATNFEYIAISG